MRPPCRLKKKKKKRKRNQLSPEHKSWERLQMLEKCMRVQLDIGKKKREETWEEEIRVVLSETKKKKKSFSVRLCAQNKKKKKKKKVKEKNKEASDPLFNKEIALLPLIYFSLFLTPRPPSFSISISRSFDQQVSLSFVLCYTNRSSH